jgi:hypothetical protein
MRTLVPLLLAAGVVWAGEEQLREAEQHRDYALRHFEESLGHRAPKSIPIRLLKKKREAKRVESGLFVVNDAWMKERAFYDSTRSEIVVPASYPARAFQSAVWHETAHAYRDAHTNITEFLGAASKVDGDWTWAVSCLMEGDAVLLTSALSLAWAQRKPLDGEIRVAAETLWERRRARVPLSHESEPYGHGGAFAARVYLARGKKGLDDAFRCPPRSTEQILHPEKYLAPEPDEPEVFTGGCLDDQLGEGWSRRTVVLGELVLRFNLAHTLGRERAAAAAAGWDGCLVDFYTKDDEELFALVSTWDTEGDAAEFAHAWCHSQCLKHGREFEVHTIVGAAGERQTAKTAGGLVVTVRRKRDVVALVGDCDTKEATGLLVRLWKHDRRTRRKDERPDASAR